MLEVLKDLISVKSVAERGQGKHTYGDGPFQALEYVLRLADEMGFRTVNNGAYGFAEIGCGKELIGILAHLDTVDSGDGWNYPPFKGTVADGKIYGRGAIDDKGPAVASLFAMKDVMDKMNPDKRIRLILGQTEENGDWQDIREYMDNEDIPDYGFTPDGSFPAIFSENGIITTVISMPLKNSGIKFASGGKASNIVPDRCEVYTSRGKYSGCGRSVHGSTPWLGKNAITDAMMKVVDAEGEIDQPFASMYMNCIANLHHGENLGIDLPCGDAVRTSVNPGKIITSSDTLSLVLEVRYPVMYTAAQIFEKLRSSLEKYSGAGVTVIEKNEMLPVCVDKNGPVINSLLDAYRDVTGEMSQPVATGGATYARAMKNIIAFGPKFPGTESTEHKSDEFIYLDEFYKLRKIYGKALINLLRI